MHPFLIFIMVIISLVVILFVYLYYSIKKVLTADEKKQKCQEDFIMKQLEKLNQDNNYNINAHLSNCPKNSMGLPWLRTPTLAMKNKIKQIRDNNSNTSTCPTQPTTINSRVVFTKNNNNSTLYEISKFMKDNIQPDYGAQIGKNPDYND